MKSLEFERKAFASVGWFIPPYATRGFLGDVATEINAANACEKVLVTHLSQLYSPGNLAAMVSERYHLVPYIADYRKIISESVEAHFLGLHHIAVSGLMPVIEGVGKRIASSRNVPFKKVKIGFQNLSKDCKRDVVSNNLGAVGEIVAILEAFVEFSNSNLYIGSNQYPLTDNTNRHGILHGEFSDADYGTPLNFYKAIGAVDFLCFVSSLNASVSFFAPNRTSSSKALAAYYFQCHQLGKARVSG